MGRKAHFKNSDFLDAAIRIIAEGGPGALTIAALAGRIHAPVGSVYHRFPSRDALLAEVWLSIIESFQGDFIRKLEEDGLATPLACLQWVRQHPAEARIMLLHRMQDLTTGRWPPELQKRARRLEKDLHDAVTAFIKRVFGQVTPENIDRAIFALYDAPLGIIRRYLSDDRVPPATVAELLQETYNAVMPKAKSR